MDNGELIKPDYVDRTFSKILKTNGFRHIRLHDLRHSCATLLSRNSEMVRSFKYYYYSKIFSFGSEW